MSMLAKTKTVDRNGGTSYKRPELSTLEYRLLNDYQRGFPATSRPFATIAEELGSDEETVLRTLESLVERKMISRIGPVFRPRRLGASTLAALAVPEARLEEIAAMVSEYGEVNHNYERMHDFNLWFVVTAASEEDIEKVLDDIRKRSRCQLLNLPMEEAYHIDLGFPLWC